MKLPAQSFSALMPLGTHWRVATCEEVDCPPFINGWRTRVIRGSEMEHTARNSGRKIDHEQADGEYIDLYFAPGQACFRASQHRLQLDRPGLLVHTNRDTRNRRVVGHEEWHERFATTLDTLAGR